MKDKLDIFEEQKITCENWDLLRCFKKNAPIESTDIAITNGVFKSKRYGNLLGFCKDGRSIRVRLHGNKSSSMYWVGFWKPRNVSTDTGKDNL